MDTLSVTLPKLILSPSGKGSTLKEKNLLPLGAKFFPFRVDPHGSKFFPFRVDPFKFFPFRVDPFFRRRMTELRLILDPLFKRGLMYENGSHKNYLPCKNGGKLPT